MRPLQLESWEINKQPYVRIFSQCVAMQSSDFFENLRDIASNNLSIPSGQPALHQWVKFYRSHRQLWRFFITRFMQFGDMPSLHAQVLHTLALHLPSNHFLAAGRDDFNVPMPTVEEANATFYADVRDDIAKVPPDEKISAQIKDAFLNHDFLFLMKIVIPVSAITAMPCSSVIA